MNKYIKTVSIVVLIFIGGSVWYIKNKQAQTTLDIRNTQPEMTPSSVSDIQNIQVESTVRPGDTKNVREFPVTATNYKFDVTEIKVKLNDTVKILVTNNEGLHDFVIDEFAVKTKRIAAGQEDTVEFIADKPGTFEYYCSVGNHRAMGMKGILTVE